MKIYYLRFVPLLFIFFTSCTLLKGYRKKNFSYGDGQQYTLLVPSHYKKEQLETDAAGTRKQSYTYKNGAVVYIAELKDSVNLADINKDYNIAKSYPEGIVFYKGADSATGLYWRESRWKNIRVGYKNVSTEKEARFDSSVNYVGWQQWRKKR